MIWLKVDHQMARVVLVNLQKLKYWFRGGLTAVTSFQLNSVIPQFMLTVPAHHWSLLHVMGCNDDSKQSKISQNPSRPHLERS